VLGTVNQYHLLFWLSYTSFQVSELYKFHQYDNNHHLYTTLPFLSFNCQSSNLYQSHHDQLVTSCGSSFCVYHHPHPHHDDLFA
jgi:hypothetical protein